MIAIGTLLIPAIETVVTHHLRTSKPLIIEGDGIIPALFTTATLHDAITTKQLRGALLTATTTQRHANMAARGERSDTPIAADTPRAGETMNEVYGDWLGQEAGQHGVPCVPAHPQATLTERFIAALDLARG